MKITIIILACVLVFTSCALIIYYNKNTNKAKNDLNQERYLRMEAEEGLQKANAKVASLTSEVERANNKLEIINKLSNQVQATNDDLKSRLDKAEEIKQSLEKSLKELEQVLAQKETLTATPTPNKEGN